MKREAKVLLAFAAMLLVGCGRGAEWDAPWTWGQKTQDFGVHVRFENRSHVPIQFTLEMGENVDESLCEPYDHQEEKTLGPGESAEMSVTLNCVHGDISRAARAKYLDGRVDAYRSDGVPAGSSKYACDDQSCVVTGL